jgi:hypothetical protein
VTTDSFLAPGYSGLIILGWFFRAAFSRPDRALADGFSWRRRSYSVHTVGRWDTDGGYSHGWLILGLIGWMLWEQRSTVFSVVRGRR